MQAKAARDRQHMRQVCTSVIGWRCADCDEEDPSMGDSALLIGDESKPASSVVSFDELKEARFKKWNFAAVQLSNSVGCNIDADNIVPNFGKAGSCHEADIASSKHRDLHWYRLA